MDLQKEIKDTLTNSVIEGLSDILSSDSHKINAALDVFLSGLLGGIAHKGSTVNGAEAIINIIEKNKFDQFTLFEIDKILNNKDKASGFFEMGSNIIGSLLGKKQSGLLEILLKKTDISKSDGTKLLNFLAPVVIIKISQLIKNKKFNASGLNKFLVVENEELLGIIPELKNLFSNSKSEIKIHSIADYQAESIKSKRRWVKWLFPLLVLLLLIWLLY